MTIDINYKPDWTLNVYPTLMFALLTDRNYQMT